jgi:hypothetical protein
LIRKAKFLKLSPRAFSPHDEIKVTFGTVAQLNEGTPRRRTKNQKQQKKARYSDFSCVKMNKNCTVMKIIHGKFALFLNFKILGTAHATLRM